MLSAGGTGSRERADPSQDIMDNSVEGRTNRCTRPRRICSLFRVMAPRAASAGEQCAFGSATSVTSTEASDGRNESATQCCPRNKVAPEPVYSTFRPNCTFRD